jgi:hypothetical protein
MASIYKSVKLSVPAAAAWDIVERYTRVDVHVFSVVAKQWLEGPVRVCVGVDGTEARELNVTVDPEHMRASYTVPDLFESTFHHASMQVFDTGDGGCWFTWITDVLPGEFVTAHARMYEGLWADLVRVLETGQDAEWVR